MKPKRTALPLSSNFRPCSRIIHPLIYPEQLT
jgi:hypothetical protein